VLKKNAALDPDALKCPFRKFLSRVNRLDSKEVT
jgi:hypothetical protein